MSLPYHEPILTTILSLSSLIITLNISRYLLDRWLYCGLLGEIIIGFIWGQWIDQAAQQTTQSFGYLGLILLVFEGGLGISSSQVRSTVGISAAIATIGLILPISLSFLLLVFPFTVMVEGDAVVDVVVMVEYPQPLAAFSAGASLCSTSLGTTLAILSAAGLQQTKVGTVLMSAAMMDDVVGLVMVKIIVSLGSSDGLAPWPIARPVVASVVLLFVTIVVTLWVLIPCWTVVRLWFHHRGSNNVSERTSVEALLDWSKDAVCGFPHLGFVFATLILYAFVSIAAFVDASTLFAAFLAGCVIKTTWIDDAQENSVTSPGAKMYEKYYSSITSTILAPFFFASVGFAIPMREMFTGPLIWKGLLYSLLMIIAKAAVGMAIYFKFWLTLVNHFRARLKARRNPTQYLVPSMKRPNHLAASIISLAMVARGEIGFLIASLASSSGTLITSTPGGIHESKNNQEVFLVIIWAICICTLVGPIGVGLAVRNLSQKVAKLLEDDPLRTPIEAQRIVLGSWG